MSDKKQIEEMAKTICKYYEDDKYSCGRCPDCYARDEAKKLYNAGYRKQEWISVDEKLPDNEGKYLVCTAKGKIYVENFVDYYGNGKRLCFCNYIVTHWMPLPEPPKGV